MLLGPFIEIVCSSCCSYSVNCGSEIWTLTKNYCKLIKAAEINFFSSVALKDGKRNDDIKKQTVRIFNTLKKNEYRTNQMERP